jgi:osmotically-inducible protein OsmY
MSNAGTAASEAASNFSDAMKAKLETLNLQPGQIKNELVKTGEVIRRKAYDIGESAVDAASDARAMTEIKAKYAGDSTLSVWKISVSCNQGHVTLSGTVSSPDDIGKAVALALDAGGVRDVTSTLQVKPSQ